MNRPIASRPGTLRCDAENGFTLVELVVVIVLSAIVIGFAAMFMTTPMDAYFAQSRRSELTESSDAIARQISVDLRRALPNSVRISNVGTRAIVELLLTDEVVFYRDGVGAAITELDVGTVDGQFHTLGRFYPGDVYPPARALAGNFHLAVGNRGLPAPGILGRDAYQLTNVITPNITQITLNSSAIPGEDSVTLLPAFQFNGGSPSNRIFLVSTPVTYICNSAANARTLRRYQDYAIGANIPASEATARLNVAGVVNTLAARDVTACRARCQIPAMPCQGGLVLEVTVSRLTNAGNDSMRVLVQAPMDNNP